MPKIIGVIPARSGSQSVHNKNIRLFHGKPLIAWTIECALASNLDRVIVSTNDDEIKEIMPYCTKIIKCKAVCTKCQKDARYTFRKAENTSEILVGGKDIYEPRCQAHHPFMRS